MTNTGDETGPVDETKPAAEVEGAPPTESAAISEPTAGAEPAAASRAGQKPRDPISFRNRLLLWIVVGGFGAYLIITGIIGFLTKSR
jgi:hypothetical protein